MILEVGAERILIDLNFIIRKDYTLDNLQFVEDQLVLHYTNQEIYFYALDGNDVLSPGFTAWVQLIQRGLHIPDNKISVVSVSPSLSQWRWIPYQLTAFGNIANLIAINSINTDTSSAKFVGVLSGSRWSVARMRLAYELDHAFPEDTFITFLADQGISNLHQRIEQYYPKEIEWIKNKKFDNDLHDRHAVDYRAGLVNYKNLWGKYRIEIVPETDEYQNLWFTDKIAKCLHTGKPFLLLSGQHSLKNLKKMGFVTFDQWIDESYDEYVLPGQRIAAIIKSLHTLYNHPDKQLIFGQMEQHAVQNTLHYQQYVQSKI
jgi:hypothetical protein